MPLTAFSANIGDDTLQNYARNIVISPSFNPLLIKSPSICHEVTRPDAMVLVFWMLSFKATFSLSSFSFIKRLFSSFSLSAIGPHVSGRAGLWVQAALALKNDTICLCASLLQQFIKKSLNSFIYELPEFIQIIWTYYESVVLEFGLYFRIVVTQWVDWNQILQVSGPQTAL